MVGESDFPIVWSKYHIHESSNDRLKILADL